MPMRERHLRLPRLIHTEVAGVLDYLTVDGDAVVVDGLADGEPIFAVRGNDALALVALNHYLLMTDGAFSDDKTRELEAIRDRFIRYQRAHRDRVKLPD